MDQEKEDMYSVPLEFLPEPVRHKLELEHKLATQTKPDYLFNSVCALLLVFSVALPIIWLFQLLTK